MRRLGTIFLRIARGWARRKVFSLDGARLGDERAHSGAKRKELRRASKESRRRLEASDCHPTGAIAKFQQRVLSAILVPVRAGFWPREIFLLTARRPPIEESAASCVRSNRVGGGAQRGAKPARRPVSRLGSPVRIRDCFPIDLCAAHEPRATSGSPAHVGESSSTWGIYRATINVLPPKFVPCL